MPARPTEMCENCMTRMDLRRCAGCGVMRYCSRECQKAHWKKHKPHCVMNVELSKRAEALGSDCSDRLKAIRKWCDVFSIPIGIACVSALDIMNHPERTDKFLLFIYVHFLPAAKPPYTHEIVDARVLPVADLRSKIPQQRLELFDSTTSPRPGMISVLLRDPGFPWNYTKPFVPPTDVLSWRRDPLWLECLQMRVTHPSQPIRPRESIPDSLDATLEQIAKSF
ncbi:hypothetical protein DFH07DRAFT_1059898 [Mycena maculata]|uniref:MYND-type domain-containing protein n=1 Tax=Mycena maculata TaxID=230809 RepID=A0AAD7NHH5_9AGAR|nr:hypothetical protein DFH07DRAFT_1059898 [Mycena maculata]